MWNSVYKILFYKIIKGKFIKGKKQDVKFKIMFMKLIL